MKTNQLIGDYVEEMDLRYNTSDLSLKNGICSVSRSGLADGKKYSFIEDERQ
jgi:hypothetical protein